MNVIEVELSDGTRATWNVEDDSKTDEVLAVLTEMLGEPDSIKA